MADGNWIKLNRKIQENFIWDFEKPRYALAWIDLLLMANYKDKQIIFDGRAETIVRGSLITSMVKLSERWCMNRKTVKAFLDILHDAGMITYKISKRRTTIYITNYIEYQDFAAFKDESTGQVTGQPDGQVTGQLTGQPDGQLTGHNIRNKEGKKERMKEVNTVSNDTVCSTDVQRVVEAWNSIGISKVTKIIPGKTRDTLLKNRIREYGIDDVLRAIENVKGSSFLRGDNKNGWTITFDWFVKPNNFPKVLDGNYDNKNGSADTRAMDYGDPEDFYKDGKYGVYL